MWDVLGYLVVIEPCTTTKRKRNLVALKAQLQSSFCQISAWMSPDALTANPALAHARSTARSRSVMPPSTSPTMINFMLLCSACPVTASGWLCCYYISYKLPRVWLLGHLVNFAIVLKS